MLLAPLGLLVYLPLPLYWIIWWYARKRLKIQPFEKVKYPPVSIIVPAHNEEKVIKSTIESLKELEYPAEKEIIIVNDGSNDRTENILERYKENGEVRVLTIKNRNGKAKAIAEGVKVATHDIIVIFDADSQPRRNCLLKLCRWFSIRQVGAVCGRIVTGNWNRNWLTKMITLEFSLAHLFQHGKHQGQLMPLLPGTCMAIRKPLCKFENCDSLIEDAEVSLALQKDDYKIIYDKEAVTLEEEPEDITTWWKQRVRWSRGNFQILKKYSFLLDYRYGRKSLATWLLLLERSQPAFAVLSLIISIYALLTLSYSISIFLVVSSGLSVVTLLGMSRDALRHQQHNNGLLKWLPVYYTLYTMLFIGIWFRSMFPIGGWTKTKRSGYLANTYDRSALESEASSG
jgi:cellulose synthase/poly-beta-1,6-N-acetylglucosamine synthase-like glycosyltransferase